MSWTVWKVAGAASSIRRGGIVLNDPNPPIWSNTANITAEDSVDADTNIDKTENSYWLRAYNFNMWLSDIPSGNYIGRVAIRFRLKAQTADQIEVNACHIDTQAIAEGGVPAGTNNADAYLLQTTYVKREFDYSLFEWGWDNLTDVDVRSTDFSTYLSLYNTQLSDNKNGYCDVVECRIFHEDPLNVLTIKSSQIGLTALKTSVGPQVARVNTPKLTLTVRPVNNEDVLQPKTSSLSLSGVLVTARSARVASVSKLRMNGVKAFPHYLNVEARASEINLTGIRASALALSYIKTPDISLTGLKVPQSIVYVKTASIGLVANLVTDSLSPDGSGDVSDIKLYYSGAATEDQYDSLGGPLSTAAGKEVYSKFQHFTATVMTGATIINAYDNPHGNSGRLDFISGPPKQYMWTPHGYSFGDTQAVDISSGLGVYLLGDIEHGFLTVKCDGTYPVSSTNQIIEVNNPRYRLFRVATPLDCHSGRDSYRCFYVKNNASNKTLRLVLWIDPQPVVATAFMVGPDPIGEGNGTSNGIAPTISDEYTAPIGVTFISPTENTPLTIGVLNAQKAVAIWVKRTVAANTTDFTLFNSMRIHIGTFI